MNIFSKVLCTKGPNKRPSCVNWCKTFFWHANKNDEETFAQIIEIERNDDYTAGNLLDYNYFSKCYKLIAIDIRKQLELENSDLKQQINFIWRLERYEGATMFSIIEKSEETAFEFSQNAATAFNSDYI